MSHHLTTEKNGTKSCGCLKKSLLQGNKITCKICNINKSIDDFYAKDKSVTTRHNICKECMKPMLNEKRKQRNKELRLLILQHYSKSQQPKCDCCGETILEFLTIDHKNGGGNQHRKRLGTRGSGMFYRWLRDNKYPKGFRILCFNCNVTIGHYGHCPHKSICPLTQYAKTKRELHA